MMWETGPGRLQRLNAAVGKATIAYHSIPGKSPGMLFLTGYRSAMEGAKALALEAYCRDAGHAYIRFDYQGHGETGGDFESCTMSTWIADAVAVLDNVTTGPQILAGSSMGGWIMVHLALLRPERVAGLLGIAAAPDLTELLLWDLFDAATRESILAGKVWRVPSKEGGNETVVSRALIDDGRKYLVLRERIPLAVPVRLLHGLADPVVPWQLSQRLLDQIDGLDVTLTLIKGGGHRLSQPRELGVLVGAADQLFRRVEALAHASPTSAARTAASPAR